MAIADRRQMVRTKGRDNTPRGKELMAGILLLALVLALGVRNIVPMDALAPVVVTLLFAAGALMAGLALLCRDRFRAMSLELAGGLTFIGVVLSVLIEPDQMIRLFALSDQPE